MLSALAHRGVGKNKIIGLAVVLEEFHSTPLSTTNGQLKQLSRCLDKLDASSMLVHTIDLSGAS